MPDSNEENEEEWDAVVVQMREARARSRDYASYWEWAPNRVLAEMGVAKALASHLSHLEGHSRASAEAVPEDPPDVLLLTTGGKRVGIEVTELVDPKTVARHRHRKKTGSPQPYDRADSTIDALARAIVEAIERKDLKLAKRAGDYDELMVALYTDEPMINFELAEQAVRDAVARVVVVRRAFLLLSYHPGADEGAFLEGIPVLSVPLRAP